MLYFKYFGIHLKSQMQYRASFFLLLIGEFVMAFTAFLGITFMLSRFHTVDGFTYEQVLLCFSVVTMAFALAEMLFSAFVDFPRMLANGEFDRALVRPRRLVLQVVGMKTDFSRVGPLVQAVLVLGYAVPKSGVVWSGGKILTLCLMMVSGAAVFSGLFLVYAGLSFFTVEGLEFMNILTYGGKQHGSYPFAIYGKGVLRFLTFVIPLALFQYYPLLYLIGREDGRLYMLSPLGALLFLLPAYGLWRFGLMRYQSTGS